MKTVLVALAILLAGCAAPGEQAPTSNGVSPEDAPGAQEEGRSAERTAPPGPQEGTPSHAASPRVEVFEVQETGLGLVMSIEDNNDLPFTILPGASALRVTLWWNDTASFELGVYEPGSCAQRGLVDEVVCEVTGDPKTHEAVGSSPLKVELELTGDRACADAEGCPWDAYAFVTAAANAPFHLVAEVTYP